MPEGSTAAEGAAAAGYRLALALVLDSSALNSFGGLIVRSVESASDRKIVFYRSLGLASGILCVCLLRHGRDIGRQFRAIGPWGLLGSVFLAAAASDYVNAITHTTVANALFILSSLPSERVLAFYNQRGTAEQHIKEGKYALKWTRLSCMRFAANAVRLQLHALAYNLANFLHTLATPQEIEKWSLTSPRERLIKIGVRLVRHARYAIFQIAEATLPREMFAGVLGLINGLRGPPAAVVPA